MIGRTKARGHELDDDVKLLPAPLRAPNVIEDADGNGLKILRHSMPFGEVGKGEYGTFYIGYPLASTVTERMLENMFIGDPPGNTDRILEFSTASPAACSSPRSSTFSTTRRHCRAPRRRPLPEPTTPSDGSLAPAA